MEFLKLKGELQIIFPDFIEYELKRY